MLCSASWLSVLLLGCLLLVYACAHIIACCTAICFAADAKVSAVMFQLACLFASVNQSDGPPMDGGLYPAYTLACVSVMAQLSLQLILLLGRFAALGMIKLSAQRALLLRQVVVIIVGLDGNRSSLFLVPLLNAAATRPLQVLLLISLCWCVVLIRIFFR